MKWSIRPCAHTQEATCELTSQFGTCAILFLYCAEREPEGCAWAADGRRRRVLRERAQALLARVDGVARLLYQLRHSLQHGCVCVCACACVRVCVFRPRVFTDQLTAEQNDLKFLLLLLNSSLPLLTCCYCCARAQASQSSRWHRIALSPATCSRRPATASTKMNPRRTWNAKWTLRYLTHCYSLMPLRRVLFNLYGLYVCWKYKTSNMYSNKEVFIRVKLIKWVSGSDKQNSITGYTVLVLYKFRLYITTIGLIYMCWIKEIQVPTQALTTTPNKIVTYDYYRPLVRPCLVDVAMATV